MWWFGGGWWWLVRVGWRLVCVGGFGWRLFCVGLVLLYCVGVWFENTHRLYRRGVWWWLLNVICRWGLDVGLGGFVWVDAFQHIVRHPVQHLFNYVDYTWYVNLLIITQLPIYSILFDILIGLTLNKQLFFIKISRGYYLK